MRQARAAQAPAVDVRSPVKRKRPAIGCRKGASLLTGMYIERCEACRARLAAMSHGQSKPERLPGEVATVGAANQRMGGRRVVEVRMPARGRDGARRTHGCTNHGVTEDARVGSISCARRSSRPRSGSCARPPAASRCRRAHDALPWWAPFQAVDRLRATREARGNTASHTVVRKR